MIIAIIFWVLKSLAILGIFQFVVPSIVNALTGNRWIKLPIMLVFAILAGIFMAWLQYVPCILFFLWLVLNKHTLRAMTEEKFESEAGMKINKPLFYISSYSYIILACFSAWFFQAELITTGDPTGQGVLLWKHLVFPVFMDYIIIVGRERNTMIGKIGAYVITLVVLPGIELPFWPITLSLAVAFKKAKWFFPFVICLLDVIKICVAVLLASWLVHKIGQSPSWLMFLIPGCLMVRNDLMRINRVKEGKSNVKRIFEQNGEPESYDQRHDLLMERAHLVGEVTGWLVGTNLVLQTMKFF